MEMKNYYIGGYFINDYAYAQLMCDMPFNAFYTITNGNSIPEESIQNQQLLGLIKNRLKESSTQEKKETNQVWKISQEEEGYNYIYSTMYGVSIPAKGSWNLAYQQSEDGNPAMCKLGIDGFTLNERPAGISMIIMIYPQSIYSEANKKNLLNMFPVIKRETEEIDNKTFEKYTFEDLTKYADARNGSRGYLYAASIEPGKWSEARCEHAADLSNFTKNSGSDSPSYYAMSPSYKRLQEPLTVFIIVDSCNALIEETDKLLSELFSKAVFN